MFVILKKSLVKQVEILRMIDRYRAIKIYFLFCVFENVAWQHFQYFQYNTLHPRAGTLRALGYNGRTKQ